MKDGFIRVAAGSVGVTVADPDANAAVIRRRMEEADAGGINLLVLPELCVSGYTCGDLFFSDTLIAGCARVLKELAAFSAGQYPITVVGLPISHGGKLYNCAAVLHDGHILGIVPKTHLPGYGEFCEPRHFASGDVLPEITTHFFGGEDETLGTPMGTSLLFAHEDMPEYVFGVELCEDLWATASPSATLCRYGATIMVNPSASNEIVGKAAYRRELVQNTSARLLCGYVCANAGPEESTQDLVFSRHHLIAEKGKLLKENPPFGDDTLTVTELDVARLLHERRRHTGFKPLDGAPTVYFSQEMRDWPLTREIPQNPFVPADADALCERAETVLNIQAYGLRKRLAHTRSAAAVIGVSGGLDSTLALLVLVRTMDLLGRPHSDIHAVTMPCFGTTTRTRSNAEILCEQLGVTLQTVDISAAVTQHFADIGQDPTNFDVTFENAQARERTQVLMDIANRLGGLVIGTGDLSELALGWATYNGDHMSMYGVNASVPKTLVRSLVHHEAMRANDTLRAVLLDVLDTPVSPELLPADEAGAIAQKTEDLVGPYALHDFFLYYTVRYGMSPRKIERLACAAFAGVYECAAIRHWLKTFVRRFFNQQFKRSCLPDGPKVGSVGLSPRGDWHMPSDAVARLWLAEMEE